MHQHSGGGQDSGPRRYCVTDLSFGRHLPDQAKKSMYVCHFQRALHGTVYYIELILKAQLGK
jgi:hypothetical protein